MGAALALGAVPTFGSALAAAGAAIGTAAAAVLASPVLLVIAVVAVVCLATVVVYQNWDSISSFFKRTWEKGKAFVGAAATAVAGTIDNCVEGIQSAYKKVALAATAGIVFMAEHTKGARLSTKNKHEKGQARRQRDQGGGKKNKNKNWKPNPNKRK